MVTVKERNTKELRIIDITGSPQDVQLLASVFRPHRSALFTIDTERHIQIVLRRL